MREIDVHHMTLKEAKEYIFDQIKKASKTGEGQMKVIHGYNNGTVIRDWLRGASLGKMVTTVMPDLLNSGVTTIHLRIKLK